MKIPNFSLNVEKYFTNEQRENVKYFSTRKETVCISNWLHDVLFIIHVQTNVAPNHFTVPVENAIDYITVAIACVAADSFPFSGGAEIEQANEKRASEGARLG